MLRHGSEHGFTSLPVPIATRDGQSFVEENYHLWELAPWMPGVADFWRTPRAAKLQASMQALARFHLAVENFGTNDAERIPSAQSAIHKRLSRLQELSPETIHSLEHAVADTVWPQLAAHAREAIATLPAAARRAQSLLEPASHAPLPLQPCLRDIWHDHILFTGDEVAGIIDFGAAHIDTPATDIARLLGSLVGDDRALWQSGLAAYESIRPLSENERTAIPGLDASGTVIALCNWIRWIYIERRQFENRQQVVDRFARLLNRLRLSS
jgi:Ser/Thr protein kinase RdoA (MazF antagonist)